MDQMESRGMTWKAYMEDIPGAGSLLPRWPTNAYAVSGVPFEIMKAW